jgi:carbamoyltransferase
MYGYATAVLGYKINRHEGKLTGLAAYGDPNRTKDIFLQHFTLDNGNRPNFKAVKIGYGLRGIKTLKKELETFSAQDIAAGVQAAFEEIILEYVSYWIHSTNCNHLYLSGGAFANVALNAKIALLDGVERLSIAPNMGDGGLALGAAALAHNQPIRFETLYLGSSLKNTTETSNLLELVYEGAELPSVIASFLKQKKTVALVQGRMEFGPRALCNRSILYSAEDVSVNSWLNERLKRTEYMPFAPVCRDVDAHKNFHLTLPLESYRHMTITCKVTDWCKATAPAIVHIDSTARPQILSQRDNPFMYSILNEYAKIAENPVLVNTSFNMHEEPIVNTGDDAVRAFLESGVTFLVLNDRVFRKRSEV